MATRETTVRVRKEKLLDFCVELLLHVGVSTPDANITADVLVAADLRGIPSHGVARLRRYIDGIRCGMMRVDAKWKVVRESTTTALIDADAGLGQPVSRKAMLMAIGKALESGSGTVAVRNSNHFGIAGYYAMMALKHNCIGLCLTNADVLVVPTFCRDARLGTNAFSVAVPAGKERPFVLDMATSTVARGKLEVHDRQEKPIPLGWATDQDGLPTDNPGLVLANLKQRAGGGLAPLGGDGELLGGHKGYGLAMLVDILCGVLSGSAFATQVYPKAPDGSSLPANLGHFFHAWRIDALRPVGEFKSGMDCLIRLLKDSPKASGQDRIWIPGEKEAEATERHLREGIPLDAKVTEDLKKLAGEFGLAFHLN